VLIVSPVVKGIGGIGRYLRELVVRLRRIGLTIELASCNFIPCIPIKGLSNPSFVFTGNIFSLTRGLTKEYDVIHVHHVFGYHAVRTAKTRGILLTLHGDFIEQMSLIYGQRLKSIFNVLEKTAVKHSDIVTAISPYISAVYSKRYDIKVINTPNAIDPNLLPKKGVRLTDKIQAVYIGRLSKEKGIDTLLKSARILDKKHNDIKLFIVGSGPLHNYVTRLTDKLNNVEYLGYKDHYSTLKIIKGSDMLILPSYKEGFPTVVLEAMALKTPVILSRIPELSFLIPEKAVFFFEKGNYFQLAEIIRKVARHSFETVMKTEYAYNFVIEKYSWNMVIDKYLNLYDKLVN